MRVLALEGALGPFSCCYRDGVQSVVRSTAGNDALEIGLEAVGQVLAAAKIELDAIERLAIGIGPGSFTGLRIAVSYAKALALAKRLPLVGIPSYDILEPDGLTAPVLTCVSGRAGIVCARLRTAAGVHVRCGPVVQTVDELARIAGQETITVVNATEDVLAALGERGLDVRNVPCRAPIPAEAVAALATRYEPAESPHAVRPDYGEQPAAKIPRLR